MSDFYTELVKKLTNPKKQKPYKESSVKPVYGYLKSLNGGQAPTSLDYLLDRPIVMKFLEKYAVNTQRTIVFAIRNVAKDFDRDDILEVWKENIQETEAGKGLPEKGEKSEAQEKAYAMLEGDVKGSAWDNVLKRVEAYDGKSDKMIAQLYTMFPPRRNLDYTEMKISADYKPTLSKEYNYLVVELEDVIYEREALRRIKEEQFEYKGKYFRLYYNPRYKWYEVWDADTKEDYGILGMLHFAGVKYEDIKFLTKEDFKFAKINMKYVFNRYKTDGIYKQQIFDVPEDLVDVLKHRIQDSDLKDGDFLLNRLGRTTGKMKSDDISDVLHKIIGSGISTQMLRHMYLDKYNNPEREKIILEMMGDAEMMGHSISTQQGTYVKK
jgi:hypothetical protein